jgi:hypothetical protein
LCMMDSQRCLLLRPKQPLHTQVLRTQPQLSWSLFNSGAPQPQTSIWKQESLGTQSVPSATQMQPLNVPMETGTHPLYPIAGHFFSLSSGLFSSLESYLVESMQLSHLP